MIDIKDISTQSLAKLIPEIVSLIPSITFIYLFLTTTAPYLFWLSLTAVLFLGLQITFRQRMWVVAREVLPKTRSPEKLGLSAIRFFAGDPGNIFLLAMSGVLALVAFAVLLLTAKDTVSWVLFFLCVLAGCYYIGTFATYAYIAKRYPRFGATMERKIEGALARRQKSGRRFR